MRGFLSAVDAGPACAFRALFGASMLLHVGRLHYLGMYRRSIVEPEFHFGYGVPFVVPPTSESVALVHLASLALASIGITLGIHSRGCCLVFAVLYAYFVLCERTMFNNHYYLYILLALLLSLVGADQTFAIGAARQRRPPLLHWHTLLLRCQVCVVYMYAGVAKLNSDWVLHHEPMRTKVSEPPLWRPCDAGLPPGPADAEMLPGTAVAG